MTWAQLALTCVGTAVLGWASVRFNDWLGRRAEGGKVVPHESQDTRIRLVNGVAIIPDGPGYELIRQMFAKDGDTIVFTASEWADFQEREKPPASE